LRTLHGRQCAPARGLSTAAAAAAASPTMRAVRVHTPGSREALVLESDVPRPVAGPGADVPSTAARDAPPGIPPCAALRVGWLHARACGRGAVRAVPLTNSSHTDSPAGYGWRAGQVLVRNRYSGVNFHDTYTRSGLYQRTLPFVLGTEGGGEVAAVGEGVDLVQPGCDLSGAICLLRVVKRCGQPGPD
jgi:hypothetical protein